ncbi:MAG: transporter substrate-binding domain-containing protein [Anaerolineae bacterium]
MSSRRDFLKKAAGVGTLALGFLGLRSEPVMAAPPARPTAQGQSKLYEVLDRGKIIVGTGSTNPPWHFEDEEGNLVGFDVEMGRLLAKGLFDDPDAVEFVREKADARIPNLQAGKVDVVFQFMTVNAQRAQLVEFSIPYYREGVNTLLLKDSPYNGVPDLVKLGSEVTVSMLQNVYAEEYVHMVMPEATVLQLDSIANTILALDAGRVYAAIVDDSTARWLAVQEPDKYKPGVMGWIPQTYAGAVKPGDTIWLNYINTVLHEGVVGVEFDFYATAFKKYFGIELSPPPMGFPVEFM